MKKALKKCITLLLTAAMVIPYSTAVLGAVEPNGAGDVLAVQNFESGVLPNNGNQDIYFTNSNAATEDNGNTMAVGKSYAGAESMGEAGRIVLQEKIFNTEPSKYLVSFDMKLLKEQAIRFYIWDKNNKAMGYFIYTGNGKIAFMTSASLPDIGLKPVESNSSYGIVDYEVDKWTSIDMMVDTENRTINYYADGAHICEAAIPATIASPYPKIFLSQMNPVQTAENFLCVDNVSVAVSKEGSFYATAALSVDNIDVTFSETPVDADFSDIKVTNTETGEEISIGEASLEGKKLTIPYSGELASSTEYSVKLPEDLKSVTGNTIYSDRVYFVSAVSGGVDKDDFFETFDDYEGTATATDCNTPDGWISYKHNTAGISRVNLYSDAAHDKTVKFYSGGWAKSILTKNFNNTMSSEFTVNFDINPLAFNNYREGYAPQEVLEGVQASVAKNDANAGKVATPENLNRNLAIYLPPVAESTPTGTAVSNTSNSSPVIMVVNGNRIAFTANSEKYAEIEKGKWYNVSLTVNPQELKATAFVTDEETGAVTDLGSYDIPANYGNLAKQSARITFFIDSVVYYAMHRDGISYTDTDGTTKKWFKEHKAEFAIDNLKVTYKGPEFKINKIRFYDVFSEDFGPLQTTTSMLNTAKVYFSEDVSQSDITSDNLIISDKSGKEYDFELISYDDENFVAEIKFYEFLQKGNEYSVFASGIKALGGSELKEYNTSFSVTEEGVFEYDFSKVTDGSGNEISGNLGGTNTLYADGYAVNTTDSIEELDVNLAAYKETSDGTKMLKLAENEFSLFEAYEKVDTENNSLTVSVSEDEYFAKTFAINTNAYKEEETKTSDAKQNGNEKIYAKTTAKADENVYIDIYDSKGNTLYKDVKAIDSDGDIEFNIVVSDTTATDSYTAKFYKETDKIVSSVEFVYANPDDKKNAVETINTPEREESLDEIIEDNYLALGISKQLYEKMDVLKTSELLEAYLEDNSITEGNVAEELNKMAAITAVANGNEDNLFDMADELSLDTSDIKDLYTKDYVTEDVEETVTKALEGEEFKSVEEFYESLNEQFVLAVVKEANGYGNAKEVIESFKSEIVGNTKISDDAYIYVANKSYDSFSDLGDALKDYEDDNDKGSGGGGGGSSNRPSSGTGSGYIPMLPDSTTDKNINVNIFDDIENVSWAKTAIVYLAEKGIVSGKSERLFYPNDNVKREELAKILMGAFLPEAEEAAVSFKDVDASAWYAPFVRKAYGSGVVKGYDEHTFGIGDMVTREDMAVMIYNSAKASGYAFEVKEFEKFSDDDMISDYAKEAVYALKNEGVVNGINTSEYAPKAYATRAEVAKIIYRLLEF